MIKKFNDFLNESKEYELEIDVKSINQEFIDEFIDKLSFGYKKLKERYLRPIKITGENLDNGFKLKVILSNKDVLDLKYKNNSELEIKLNGDVLYFMDDIEKDNVIDKIHNVYTKILKDNKFKLTKKSNPFECLDLSIYKNN